MKTYLNRYKYLLGTAILLLVVLMAVFNRQLSSTSQEDTAKTVYTCSMHPQIKQEQPGKCPICGMDLIPLHAHSSSAPADDDEIMLSPEAMALANVETEQVGTGSTQKTIRLFGKVQPDERKTQTQSAYVEGRVEKMLISAVGDRVQRGQTVAVIYSPSLYTAQQELLAALKLPAAQRDGFVAAAKEKLRLLNMTPGQIEHLVRTRKASPYYELKANTGGTVIAKLVNQGDYVKQGQPLLRIADLSTVWLMFRAYESDLPFVRAGSTIRFTAEALPGETFVGKVAFVEPVLDAQSRTAGVRVQFGNKSGRFKPEMLLTGELQAALSQYGDHVIVPKSAVLWTGMRSVVYVKSDDREEPTFRLRRIELGPELPQGYVVTDGLAEGEEVVTNGAYAVDATAQLEGKRSMMNQ